MSFIIYYSFWQIESWQTRVQFFWKSRTLSIEKMAPDISVASCRFWWRAGQKESHGFTGQLTISGWVQIMPKKNIYFFKTMNIYFTGVLQCTFSKQHGGISFLGEQHYRQKTTPSNMVWKLEINNPSHLKHLTYCQSWAGIVIPRAVFLKQFFKSTSPAHCQCSQFIESRNRGGWKGPQETPRQPPVEVSCGFAQSSPENFQWYRFHIFSRQLFS